MAPNARPNPIQGPSKLSPARLAIIVATVVALFVGAAGCGSSGSVTCAGRVSLAQLAARQDHYSGDVVTTTGTVRRFGQGASTYYVIEDAAHHRVEVAPNASFSGHVGDDVTVTGRFTLTEDRGRHLDATKVTPAT